MIHPLKMLHPLFGYAAVVGVLCYVYGLLAQQMDIFFFWESQHIGMILLFVTIGVALAVNMLVQLKIAKNDHRIWWEGGLRIVIILVVVVGNGMVLLNPTFAAAKAEIRADLELKKELGEIQGFGWFPRGSIQTGNKAGDRYQQGSFILLVKGEKRYKELGINMVQINGGPWEIQKF